MISNKLIFNTIQKNISITINLMILHDFIIVYSMFWPPVILCMELII